MIPPNYKLKVLYSGLGGDIDGPTVWLVISTSNRFQVRRGYGVCENAQVVFCHDEFRKTLKHFRNLTAPE